MGKGSKQRPTNHAAFSENYDLIFGRATVDKLAEENGCAIERVRERMTLIEASRKEHATRNLYRVPTGACRNR